MLFLRPLGGIRTHMSCVEHWNLNPARLPVSPRGVVSPRLTLGDRADLSALCQFEGVSFLYGVDWVDVMERRWITTAVPGMSQISRSE